MGEGSWLQKIEFVKGLSFEWVEVVVMVKAKAEAKATVKATESSHVSKRNRCGGAFALFRNDN